MGEGCGSGEGFLDWRQVGLEMTREALRLPIDWSVPLAETEVTPAEGYPDAFVAEWHPVTRQTYFYWRMTRDRVGVEIPDRGDFDPPVEVPLLCPRLLLLELVPGADGTATIHWRLAGTRVVDGAGIPVTGLTMPVRPDEPADGAPGRLLRVLRDQRMRFRRGPPLLPARDPRAMLESLYMPITDRRRGHAGALGIAVYQEV